MLNNYSFFNLFVYNRLYFIIHKASRLYSIISKIIVIFIYNEFHNNFIKITNLYLDSITYSIIESVIRLIRFIYFYASISVKNNFFPEIRHNSGNF